MIIYISAAPKSASTYLSNLLNKSTGLNKVFFIQKASHGICFHNSQDIIESNVKPGLVQHHTPPSIDNIKIMKKHKIKPIITTRSIMDTVVSWKEHVIKSKTKCDSNLCVPKNFRLMNDQEKFRFIILNHIPWYMNFYSGWLENDVLPTVWVDYEDIVTNTKNTINKIHKFYGLPELTKDIDVSKMNNRFNVGRLRRGEELLSTDNKELIRNLVNSWDNKKLSDILL
jgi:hypothetical protein